LGHRRIAYLAGILSFSSAQERLAGYREALANSGIPFDEDICGEGDWTNEAGEAFMLYLLEQSPRPTARVTANDLMAMGALFGAASADAAGGRI
jgi:LacI family transcriptional regulator